MERYGKKNKENPQRTSKSRSTMFPSLRRKMDWWKYRSTSHFPLKDMQESWEELRERQVFQGQQWRRATLLRYRPFRFITAKR
jgi:hypothetical protein